MPQTTTNEERGQQVAETTVPVPAWPETSFTPEEEDAFRRDDRHAAAAVAGIMLGIFALAVVMYTIIAVVASTGP